MSLSRTNSNHDDEILRKMGYAPTLHRGLGVMMNFAFGFTEVAVLSSIVLTYGLGLTIGGPATVFWGYCVQCFMIFFVSQSMAEICGAYPSAGSVYHWAGQLASG
jgi:amino acid transporter